MEKESSLPEKAKDDFLAGNIVPLYNYIDAPLACACECEEGCGSVTCSALT